jgi:nucleotide-binding universal stress UspA family protein
MSELPNKVLLATDGSEDAAVATLAAVDIASRSGSELHVVHVWHDVPSPYAHSFVKRELKRQGQEILDEQVKKIEDQGVEVSGAHLREGRISDEVIALSEELSPGLLVVGSRGQGRIGRILMGSHSEDIVHHAYLPVLVLRRGAVWPPTRLVIGDDYSKDAKMAASMAVGLGELFGIQEAVLVHAYSPLLEEVSEAEVADYAVRRQAEEDLKARAAKLENVLGYRPRTKLVAGDAAVAILEVVAQEGDGSTLVTVGSRGLGAVGRARLGSTSTKVVRAALGPVLIYSHAK